MLLPGFDQAGYDGGPLTSEGNHLKPRQLINGILIPLVCLSLSGMVCGGGPYTWVDEDGTRHYGANPPDDYPYEELGPANELVAGGAASESPEGNQAARKASGSDAQQAEPLGQCAQAEQRLERYEEQLRARADASGDEQALASEFAALESYRENLRAHCNL